MDKALATVLATPSAEDRYFIGEALLGATVLFVLNRYTGAYLDRLGLKPLAEQHAEATLGFLDRIRTKSVTPADSERQEQRLQEALAAIRVQGASGDAERVAEEALARALVESGAMGAQARDLAREVTIIVQISVRGS